MKKTGIIKETMDAFMDSYETIVDNVAILTKIVQKQQEQINQQEREIQYCQRRIELLQHTNIELSNHIYAHLHAIEAVTKYDYLQTVIERDRE